MEEKLIKLTDIQLRQGYNVYDYLNMNNRIENLDNTTLLYKHETISRWTGTGYRTDIYRVNGTNDAVIIDKNCIDAMSRRLFDAVEVKLNYFGERQNYGQECNKLSKELNIPWEIVSAVSPVYIRNFIDAVKNINVSKTDINEYTHELIDCGIDRRKDAIFKLIGHNISSDLKSRIKNSGQMNSLRMSEYIAGILN